MGTQFTSPQKVTLSWAATASSKSIIGALSLRKSAAAVKEQRGSKMRGRRFELLLARGSGRTLEQEAPTTGITEGPFYCRCKKECRLFSRCWLLLPSFFRLPQQTHLFGPVRRSTESVQERERHAVRRRGTAKKTTLRRRIV